DHDQGLQIRLVPNVGVSHYCFVFDVIERTLLPGTILKLGRYSDKKTTPDRLSFKSKVVSRSHAELWMEDGKIYIRDAGSSSGTFVNRARLSRINTAGHEIIHGDIIQLGVDYKGGQESMYRAVRMRLEVNRQGQQQRSMPFTRSAFQQLQRQLSLSSLDIQECCICLYAVAPFQALFISPCSHIFHYRCLRPILTQNYPGFSCPLCRNYSDLEANVALEMAQVMEMLGLD
ncbi:SMAD/FHA domain-containing protein, partial [Radiomyces spectabilis]|uniref:SMAD/FHA domain-containing protein n=1 Tax=Radiomyces spectabilis TaxID=64574 RepID=UPI0022207308